MKNSRCGALPVCRLAEKIVASLLLIGWLLALSACQPLPIPTSGPVSASTAPLTSPTPTLASVSPIPMPILPRPAPEEQPRPSLTFQRLAQDAPLGDRPKEPFYGVIAGPDDLDRLTARLPRPALLAARPAVSPQTLILVAFAGVKGSSGYQIAIQSIWQEDDRIIIQVAQTRPIGTQVVEPARTLPFCLVEVARSALPSASALEFVFQDETGLTLEKSSLTNSQP